MNIKKLLVAVFLLLIVGGAGFFFYTGTLKNPVNASDTTKREIAIEDGSSGKQIAKILKDAGVIRDERYFITFANQNNLNNLKSGVYEISPSQNLEEILQMLNVGGRPIGEKVTIIEGSNVKQIAQLLADKNLVNKDEFIALANDKNNFSSEFTFLQDPSITSLEGYLYPETYFIRQGTSATDIIKMLLSETKSKFEANNVFEIPENLKPYVSNINDLITLSSIVEKESINTEDAKMITGVFIKRLSQNMPLQSCPTVEYITGIHRGRVTYEETLIDSPFNTYINRGLTPAPITSPTVETINAVKNFTPSDYLFFVSDLEGKIVYSKTYEEHLQATKNIYGEY